MVFLFRVKLKGILKPPVWRELEVPAHYTFWQLHQLIQASMGWSGTKLYEYSKLAYRGEWRIATPNPDDEDYRLTYDAAEVPITAFFKNVGDHLLYIYDFEDDWIHEIVVQEIHDVEADKAVCVKAKGTCPPENCGGPDGYEQMKRTLVLHPDSPEADLWREKVGMAPGEKWQLRDTNVELINEKIRNI